MRLGRGLQIDSTAYASQGNAILGIRDSGKTYTATYIAEQLLNDGIPFVAFDPIGIWKYLKVGANGNKGFPVVVAGEGGDLPLTPSTAVDIVRAAMKENVSLVVDLYSMQLTKADWRQIVEKAIRLLLYENKTCGLRHIFIEEASEFVPQRVQPEQGRVYAEIEKLARMGGNASLGYTLINQRAEEVHKAVLELCDCLFLHRQKGRHSLTALGKWLDVADTPNTKEVINSLPSLDQGLCWVWLQGSHRPQKVKIPQKQTVHPDRRHPLILTPGITADVSEFVTRMTRSLLNIVPPSAVKEKIGRAKTIPFTPVTPIETTVMENNNNNNTALYEEQISTLTEQLRVEKKLHKDTTQRLEAVKKMLLPQYEQMKKIFDRVGEGEQVVDNGNWQIWLDKFSGKPKLMLEMLIQHKRLDRRRWCLLAGVTYTSGRFDEAARKFQQLKLVAKEGNDFVLQPI